MDRWLHPLWVVGWNYLPIPELQRCSLWRLGMDKNFFPIIYCARDNLSTPGLNLMPACKGDLCQQRNRLCVICVLYLNNSNEVFIFKRDKFLWHSRENQWLGLKRRFLPYRHFLVFYNYEDIGYPLNITFIFVKGRRSIVGLTPVKYEWFGKI